ncbi:MAG: hypothetical protein ABEI74_00665 [Candidatus Pacearchaeota archaeon]
MAEKKKEFESLNYEDRPFIFSNYQLATTVQDTEFKDRVNAPIVRAGIFNSCENGGNLQQKAIFLFENDLEKLLSSKNRNEVNNKALIQMFHHQNIGISENQIRNSLAQRVREYITGPNPNATHMITSKELEETVNKFYNAADDIYRKPISYHKISQENIPQIGIHKDENTWNYISNINQELVSSYTKEIFDGKD